MTLAIKRLDKQIKGVSLKEIAADLGVSHVLVSRVLSKRMGTTRVSEKTRLAIIKRAEELNYSPNPLAVALKQGRKGAVGLFMHGVGSPGSEISLRFIEAASKAMIGKRANLLLRLFESDEQILEECTPLLKSKLDGLIVAGLHHPQLDTCFLELEKSGLSIITAYSSHQRSHVTNIQANSESQGRLPTEHLIEIGCQRIAFFTSDRSRFAGSQEAMKKHNREIDPALCIQADYSLESAYEAIGPLIESGQKFDGLVCQSDSQAAGVMRYLVNAGWPEKDWPRITGVDDSPIAKIFAHIPLTSVTSGIQETARLAVESIFEKIDGKTVESICIEPKLVIRQSTQPV